jgi:hypothetical protein
MPTQPGFVARLVLASALLAFASVQGCAQDAASTGNSNTNWLKGCEADGDCGSGLTCLCGTCTLACETNSECGTLGGSASCASAAAKTAACSTAMPPSKSLCLQNCSGGGTCAAGRRCVAGACVPGATAELDASEEGTGGSPENTGGASGGGTGGATGGTEGRDASPDHGTGGHDAGSTDAITGDGGLDSCVGLCGPGLICVEDQVHDFFARAPDAGECPTTTVATLVAPNHSLCEPPTHFRCVSQPKACTGVPNCTCAASLCPYFPGCSLASPGHVLCVTDEG